MPSRRRLEVLAIFERSMPARNGVVLLGQPHDSSSHRQINSSSKVLSHVAFVSWATISCTGFERNKAPTARAAREWRLVLTLPLLMFTAYQETSDIGTAGQNWRVSFT